MTTEQSWETEELERIISNDPSESLYRYANSRVLTVAWLRDVAREHDLSLHEINYKYLVDLFKEQAAETARWNS